MHSLVEELKLFAKAVQVEVVADVLLINFNKKLMSFEVAEPTDPACTGLAVVIVKELVL